MTIKKVFRGLNNKNKGFTLIEIVLAIAVLAIVVTPVFNSLITSFTVNRNSRKLMAANDAAQTIMEGFSDKTYELVKQGILNGDTSISFCSISDNYFNSTSNCSTVSGLSAYYPVEATSSELKYHFSTSDMTVSTASIVSRNDVLSGFDMCKYFEMHCSTLSSNVPVLYYAFTSDENVGLVNYYNVVNGGYTFDVSLAFYPTASVSTDEYYPYGISLLVYDHNIDPSLIESDDPKGNPLLSMSSGMRAE